MHTAKHLYTHKEHELHGFIAHHDVIDTPRPAVLIAHDWTGRNEFACNKARMIAEMGYIGFALDMYGQARLGSSNDEKMTLMNPLASDRSLLRDRVCAAFEAVKELPEVDKNRIAIIGFCFGGLCALDLARSGADIKGVVSFHGLLGKPEHLESSAIKTRVLVLHGYDDPMVKPAQVNEFCREMTKAQVDWQVHMYGRVQHAFTNPDAHDTDLGLIFNSMAAERSWLAMSNFLNEIF
jgi:dienelactone hydrolase